MAGARCMICRHEQAGPGLIKGAIGDWTLGDATRYASQFGLTFSEPTWFLHRKRVREAANQTDAEPTEGLKTVTNTELLEGVRDFAFSEMKKGRMGSLKDGLRAVQLLEARKTQDEGPNLLALLTTGHSPRIQIMDEAPDEETEP